jgi:murein L,D-transpeptidase YcbB/YkuD
MQRPTMFLNFLRYLRDSSGLYLSIILLCVSMSVFGARKKLEADSSVQAPLKSVLTFMQSQLYYPASANRFYKSAGYKLIWLAPDTVKTHASEAMMMLDCVLHYGLNHDDYHPGYLTYDRLNALSRQGNGASMNSKAEFDVFLTDAILAFINHLHYGKLNPNYPSGHIDTLARPGFNAALILNKALKSGNFWSVIESVQPKTKTYTDLQDYMRLVTGQYAGDCYEMPDSTIRLMAINLERLRWTTNSDSDYLQINIPTYTLTLHQADTAYIFKVIVGKPSTPTPRLESKITHFTTAPEWKVPHSIFVKDILPKALHDKNYLENNHFAIYNSRGIYQSPTLPVLKTINKNAARYYARQSSGCDNALGSIVFRFKNVYDIYLHDTPQQNLFIRNERALSHGCIRVEHASNLAALLLKYDNQRNQVGNMQKAIAAYQKQTFKLNSELPIKITYTTCEILQGILTIYKDIYQLDKQLEKALDLKSASLLTIYPVSK